MKSSVTIAEYLGVSGFMNIGLGAIGALAAMTLDPVDVLGEPVEPKCWKIVEFDNLVQMIRENCVQLFDVRNKEEVEETGMIPRSVHIPLFELETALQMDNEEFEKKYRAAKPSPGDFDIVMTCKSGKRSKLAMQLFHRYGYKYTRVYLGSFDEYSTKKSHISILPKSQDNTRKHSTLEIETVEEESENVEPKAQTDEAVGLAKSESNEKEDEWEEAVDSASKIENDESA